MKLIEGVKESVSRLTGMLIIIVAKPLISLILYFYKKFWDKADFTTRIGLTGDLLKIEWACIDAINGFSTDGIHAKIGKRVLRSEFWKIDKYLSWFIMSLDK